ncbi:hypothetical protein A8B79_15690 [Balneola sp. EhC07]|uniref:hypothetical protein n=1 Tax=Balneola sp. EhC07 TaxID=1849360 RepID=UPI0007F4AAD9|nr:hypothetical protein [Balneola sp. EhC07]OAN63255.1 hypothetical protein A8B79_15690 [Balneola sp. EhC07]
MNSSLVYILLLFFIVYACSGASVFETKEELTAHIYDPMNEFTTQVQQGDFTLTATYLPLELMLASETEYLNQLLERGAAEGQIAKQKEFIEKYKQGYEQNLYFKMVIAPVKEEDLIYAKLGSGFDSYSHWLQKLLFGIKEEITLVTEQKQEVPLLSYQMDRNYGTVHSRSFLLTFPRQWNEQQVFSGDKFLIRVDEFGLGVGRVRLPFNVPFPKVDLKSKKLQSRN